MTRRWIRAVGCLLAFALILPLAACQRTGGGETEKVPVTGLYTCYSLSVYDLPLDPARKWLRLLPDGHGVLYLSERQEPGTWTLEGDAFRWLPEGPGVEAVGTWTAGVLDLTIGESVGVFVREGVDYDPEQGMIPAQPEPPGDETEGSGEEAAEEPSPETAGEPGAEAAAGDGQPLPPPVTTLSCYDGQYYVDYDPEVFTPGGVGGGDLEKADGAQFWFSRMTDRGLTEAWLTGMEEKGKYQQYLSYEGHSGSVAGYPFQAIVCQDETGWQAEALVDLGTEPTPEGMYAVYLTAKGSSRQTVWTDGLRKLLPTLRLGESESQEP